MTSSPVVLRSLLLLALVVLVLHGRAIQNELYWDDRGHVLGNQLLGSVGDLKEMFTHELYYKVNLDRERPATKVDTYRPMYNASFWMDAQVWKMSPKGFHLTNILIHIFNVFLFFLILRNVVDVSYAFAGALLFGIHPQTVESIHYVAGRADSLCALFCLAALYFRKRNIVLMSLFVFLGLLVKENALFFLPFWGAMVIAERNEIKWRARVMGLASLIVTAGVYFSLRRNALHGSKMLLDVDHILEIFCNFPAYVWEFGKAWLVPSHWMPMQHMAILRPPYSLSFLLLIAGIYGVGTLLLLWVFKKRWNGIGWLVWIPLFLVPSFGATSLTETMSPRYFYIPLLGGVACVVLLASQVTIRARLRVVLTTCILMTSFLVSSQAATRYATGETFYRAILEDNPVSIEAKYNLANTLYRNERIGEAASVYREMVQQHPQDPSLVNNLGVALLALGRADDAIVMFERALRIQPGNTRYQGNLAKARQQKKMVR